MTSILKTDEIQSQNGGAVVKMQTLKHPSASGNNLVLGSDGSATINQISSSSVFPTGHVIGVYSDNYTRSSGLDISNGAQLWSELDVSIPATSTTNKLVVQVHIPGISDKGTTDRYLSGAGLKYSTDSWSSSTTLGASEYILAPSGFDNNGGQVRESAVYQTYTAVPTSLAFRIRTYINASGDIEFFSQGTGEATMIVWLIQG